MNIEILNVNNVGKAYMQYKSNIHRFASWFGIPTKAISKAWAVKSVSFSMKKGEVMAIIGQNGAGKSTLLKLITGTIRPTTGSININGRVSAILELGLGFNDEFTGRENVFHSGGLLGFSSSEIIEMIPEIEDFAEIGEFFDQPVRTYSSGMVARLAFSLATASRPDILIVDEILSVGDTYFQHKSFNRIRDFKDQGSSILIVTHSMGDVREICDRVILLDKGSVLTDGSAEEVVDYYNALIAEKEDAKLSIQQRRTNTGWVHTEFGNRMANVEEMYLFDVERQKRVSVVSVGTKLEVRMRVRINKNLPQLVIGHRINDRTGHVVWGTNTWHQNQKLTDLKEGEIINSKLNFDCNLGHGSYAVCFGIHSSDTHLEECYHKADNHLVFEVFNTNLPLFIGTSYLDAKFSLIRDGYR